MPPTRAKSPKLGRRKSCSDAANSISGDKSKGSFARGTRHSIGIYKEDINNTCTDNSKDPINVPNGNATCNFSNEPKPMKETNELTPPEINGHGDLKIAVQS